MTSSTANRVRHNAITASAWAATDYPGGDVRRFDPCRVDLIVVKRRNGETHPVAVGLNLTVTIERRRADLDGFVRPIGGVR